MTFRWTAKLALVFCMSLLLFSSLAYAQQISLRYAGGVDGEIEQAIIAAFEAEHPNIDIVPVPIPGGWETYEQKILTFAAAGDLPDIMIFQDEPFPAYAARNIFLDITGYVERDPEIKAAIANNEIMRGALEAFQFNPNTGTIGSGRQYGFTYGGGEVLIYYNQDMFDEAGIPYPFEGWTWEQVREYSLKMTKHQGNLTVQYGFAHPSWWLYSWLPMVWSSGGRFYNEDYTASAFSSPEALDALTLLRDMVLGDESSPSPVGSATMGPRDLFDAGDVAMALNGPWNVNNTREAGRQNDYRWDITPHMPVFRQGVQPQTRLTWDGVTIARTTKHPKAAFEFIKFKAFGGGQEIIARFGDILPAARWAAESELWARPDTPAREEAFVEGLQYARLQPVTLTWPQFNQEIWKQHDLMLSGAKSPEQTMADVDRIIDRLAAEHQRLLESLQAKK